MKLFILFSLFHAVAADADTRFLQAGVVTSSEDCSGGKVFNECGTMCPLTCDNYFGPEFLCTDLCVNGCFCPEGTVENGEECVKPESCPQQETTEVQSSSTTEDCTGGKVFNECGTMCPLTCDNYFGPEFLCTDLCVKGCFCPEGTVENGEECVKPESCPQQEKTEVQSSSTTEDCSGGKVFNECGTMCPLTCDNYFGPEFLCTDLCVTGCFCPEGTVENGEECVKPESCPQQETTEVQPSSTTEDCTGGKVFNECGTMCPLTCDNYFGPEFLCTDLCVKGCFCPEGTVENGEECVKPESCPQQEKTEVQSSSTTEDCSGGKVFNECGTMCPLTCDNYFGPEFLCTDLCVTGCFCPEGTVENGEECVKPESCPQQETTEVQPSSTTEDCTGGKVFNECGTMCPLTCDNYFGPEFLCTDLCVEGCFCPEGTVENGEECVKPESCPQQDKTEVLPSTSGRPTTGIDAWFDVAKENYSGELQVKRCSLRQNGDRPVPKDGDACYGKTKACFFGNQLCGRAGADFSYPDTLCECIGKTWTCDEELACPPDAE